MPPGRLPIAPDRPTRPDALAPPARRAPRATWLAALLLWAVAVGLFARGWREMPAEGAASASTLAPAGGKWSGGGRAALAGGPADAAAFAARPDVPPASSQHLAPAAPGGDGPAAPPPATAPQPAPPTETPTPGPPTETPPPSPTPAPTSPPRAAGVPVLPVVDAAMKGRLRAVLAEGAARGRRGDVLIKVGDSLSVSGFFLTGLGCDTSRLGPNEDLRALIDLYRAAEVPAGASVAPCGAANALTRLPLSAAKGWTTAQVLAPLRDAPPECPAPDDSPLRCEVALLSPGVALVLLGTNDVHLGLDPARYGGHLGRVVDELVGLGVVPLLSTLPPRTDRAAMAARTNAFNDVVLDVAASRQAPLYNLWADLQDPGMVRGGMEPDGIHMSALGYGAALTEGGLRYGQNRRNLGVLRALAKLRAVVFDDGPPDG